MIVMLEKLLGIMELHFTKQSRLLTTQRKQSFENIVEKGENAGNQHFLFFPQCFLLYLKQISTFDSHSNWHLHKLPIWTGPKF